MYICVGNMHVSLSLFLSHHFLSASLALVTCARALRVWLNSPSRLIVSFLLEPASWIPAEVEPSRLVVDEDGEHEGKGGQPPDESEIHNTRVYTLIPLTTFELLWSFNILFTQMLQVLNERLTQWFLTFLKTGNTFDCMKNLRNTKINDPKKKKTKTFRVEINIF